MATSDERLAQLQAAASFYARYRGLNFDGKVCVFFGAVYVLMGYFESGAPSIRGIVLAFGALLLVCGVLIIRRQSDKVVALAALLLAVGAAWNIGAFLASLFTNFDPPTRAYSIVVGGGMAGFAYEMWRWLRNRVSVPDAETLWEVPQHIEDMRLGRATASFRDISFVADYVVWDATLRNDMVLLVSWAGPFGRRSRIVDALWLRKRDFQLEGFTEESVKRSVTGRVRMGNHRVIDRARMSAEAYGALQPQSVKS